MAGACSFIHGRIDAGASGFADRYSRSCRFGWFDLLAVVQEQKNEGTGIDLAARTYQQSYTLAC